MRLQTHDDFQDIESVDELRNGSEAVGEFTNWPFIGDDMIGAFFHDNQHACVYRNSNAA